MLNFTLEDLQNALGGALNATSNAVTTTIGAPATLANYMFGGAAVNAVAPLPAGFIDPTTTCDAALAPAVDAAVNSTAPIAPAVAEASSFFADYANWLAGGATTLVTGAAGLFWSKRNNSAVTPAPVSAPAAASASASAANVVLDATKKALLVHYRDDAGYIGFVDGLQQSSIRLINEMSNDKLSNLKNNLLANTTQGGKTAKTWEHLKNGGEGMVNTFINGFNKPKATAKPN